MMDSYTSTAHAFHQKAEWPEKEIVEVNRLDISPQPNSYVKIHLQPDETTLAALQHNGGDMNKKERLLEEFYDTTYFDLLGEGCWLRHRINLDTNEEAWCLQTLSRKIDEFTLAYEQEVDLEQIVSKLRSMFSTFQLPQPTEDAWNPACWCSNRFATFLTYRYHPFSSVCLDYCWFDIQGTSTYSVVTWSNIQDTGIRELLQGSSSTCTKIVEYLRRNAYPQYEMICEKKYVFKASDEASCLAPLDRPRVEDLKRINPLLFDYEEKKQLYDDRAAKAKQRYLPELLNDPAKHGKWVAVFDKECEPMVFADTHEQAAEKAIDEKKKIGANEFYLFRIVPAGPQDLDSFLDDQILLQCRPILWITQVKGS